MRVNGNCRESHAMQADAWRESPTTSRFEASLPRKTDLLQVRGNPAFHSQRMAVMGSMRAARSAGKSDAAQAMTASAKSDPAITQGSPVEVW
jgi:hypothetical protein